MLDEPDADPDLLVAAVRYVATREITGHEWQIRELIDRRLPKRLRREFEAACVDAIVQTSEDSVDAAKFVVQQWKHRRSAASARMCENALRRLGGAANEAMLRELGKPGQPASTMRKMAVLLGRLSEVAPPEPVGPWSRKSPEQRGEMLDRWRSELTGAGRLELPEAETDDAENEDPMDGEKDTSGYFEDDGS